jgi:hypothetical protein
MAAGSDASTHFVWWHYFVSTNHPIEVCTHHCYYGMQLMLFSGTGPKTELEKPGCEVVKDLLGV